VTLEQGLIHVYTGKGKGKTTASLGLAFRAAGQGLSVLVLQFYKPASTPSGECAWHGPAPEGPGRISFRRLELRHPFFDRQADKAELARQINEALAQLEAEWQQGLWDLVVLDEVNIALRDKAVSWEAFARLLQAKPLNVELVCTGRGAPPELMERADYVTEMLPHKHPYEKKIAARKGIEF